jgi:hypothetical protein
MYPDSSRGAPDFFAKASVAVREIVFCQQAVHFLFEAKQSGRRRTVCLVIAEPTYSGHLAADSVLTDERLLALEDHVEWQRHVFALRLRELRDIVGASNEEGERVAFDTGWFRRPPKIYPAGPLRVDWKGRGVELVGTLDVYFRP